MNPFLYIAGRGFYRITPRHPLYPEALTAAKAEKILEAEGQTFILQFSSAYPMDTEFDVATLPHRQAEDTPKRREFHAFEAILQSHKITQLDRVSWAKHQMMRHAEAFYEFIFQVPNPIDVVPLYDRRDYDLSITHAYEHFSFHWGLQNWGGLDIQLLEAERCLFRTEIDVFAPRSDEPIARELRIRFLSFDSQTYPSEWKDDEVTRLRNPTVIRQSDQSLTQSISGADVLLPTVKCLKCGSNVEVDLTLHQLQSVISGGGVGYILMPCDYCGHRLSIRRNSDAEARAKGALFEIKD